VTPKPAGVDIAADTGYDFDADPHSIPAFEPAGPIPPFGWRLKMKRSMPLFLAVLILMVPAFAIAAPEEGVEPEYEMTTYYVGLLYRGSNWTPERTDEVMQLQQGHMENIRKMADEGHLLLAGPFINDGDLRGMFVFQVESKEEAEKLVALDPAVQAGRLRMEIHPWYSARGINIDQGREDD
jgi:uncharacterized protein YciI